MTTRTLYYWIARSKSRDNADIRGRTRAEVKASMHRSYHTDPIRVQLTYEAPLDIVVKCSGKNTNEWEKR